MISRHNIIALTILATTLTCFAQSEPLNHHALNMALRKEVNDDGTVRYKDIREHRHAMLLAYLDAMANTNVDLLSREEQLAYYINVFNATVIDQIVQRWHDGFAPTENGSAMFKEKTVRLSRNKKMSLDDVEEMTRKLLKDPRVHAALSKGMKSSPPLRQHEFEAEDIDSALDAQMKRFVNDPSRNTIDRENRKLRLSKIFERYADDFGGVKALPKYLSKYVEGGSVEGFAVEFQDFDTSLNAAP